MDQTYNYSRDIINEKSLANKAFSFVRSNCCDTSDLTNEISQFLKKDSRDFEILRTHKYSLIYLGNKERNLFKFGHFPGAYLITNYYSTSEQINLANSILKRHINPPNKSNFIIPNGNLLDDEKFIKKFKWATCGEQYDWGERKYLKSLKLDNEFILLIEELINNLYPELESHIPDAVIINLYNGKYHLNLHKEDAEESDAPVVTISLGRSAIFMLGRDDFDSLPMPILVNSGDVFIMSKESRFSLHGIVKLISQPIQENKYNVFGNPIYIRNIYRNIINSNNIIDSKVSNVLNNCRLSISIRRAKL